MVAKKKQSLLIVEDDLDVAEMLEAYFRAQSYDVHVANLGEEGVALCVEKHPDLVLLDIRLPDIDGYEVAIRLRNHRRTQNIPIIFLTEKRTRDDRLQGLELGADDYITKPFDVQELKLRVRNALARSYKGAVKDPVTEFPIGNFFEEKLREVLLRKTDAVVGVYIKNMDAFRERYGFVAADDVLRAVGLILKTNTKQFGQEKADVIGHLTPVVILLRISPAIKNEFVQKVGAQLKQALALFYPQTEDMQLLNAKKRLDLYMRELDLDLLEKGDTVAILQAMS